MLFKRIAHVCLHVTDLQRSLAYYGKLGFTEVFHFTRQGKDFGRYLQIADKCYLELFEEPGRVPMVNNGIVHFCLETDDLEGLTTCLDGQGVASGL